jgi:hypothetical protein
LVVIFGSSMSPEISSDDSPANNAACSGECPYPGMTCHVAPPAATRSPAIIRSNRDGTSGTPRR